MGVSSKAVRFSSKYEFCRIRIIRSVQNDDLIEFRSLIRPWSDLVLKVETDLETLRSLIVSRWTV